MAHKIESIDQLEEMLSRPSDELVELFTRMEGDIIFLGVNGKIGISMAHMAKRATDLSGVKRRIIGLARFSDETDRGFLESIGIETIKGDLSDREFVSTLPQVENVVYLVGMKFGSIDNLSLTWAMNSYVPGLVATHYTKSKIVALSTGCVYPLTSVESGGSVESDTPIAIGEYAQSCLGRERMFEFGCNKYDNPVALIRLNYSVEMRYGLLLDIAMQVKDSKPIDLTMGYFNVIWQGESNEMILRSFDHCSSPAKVLNISGDEILSVREVAKMFGNHFNIEAKFVGKEAETALLNNAGHSHDLFGKPKLKVQQIIEWIANWLKEERVLLNKPTHFEVRDGIY